MRSDPAETPLRGRAWAIAVVCGLWFAAAGAMSAQTGAVAARAASVTGPSLLASSSGATVALTPGYILNPGDRIDTRAGGQVVIDLSDGSMVVVSPGSLVLLKDFRQASSLRELFEITLGSVRVKINHFGGRPNPYRMNSPTASIAVRGTEFSIEVDARGSTTVIVYEGAVEVAALSDPSQTTLVEAGRGVLVQSGQGFRYIAQQGRAGDPGDHNNNANDADRHNPAPPPPVAANAAPPAPPPNGAPGQMQGPGQQPPGHPEAVGHYDGDDGPGSAAQSANSSAYDRYISGLADVAQLPFLLRYNAFADSHLDSLENPAYAAQFRSAEARLFVLPSYSGTAALSQRETPVTPGGSVPGDFSISPQLSVFTPLGASGLVLGGSLSASRVGNQSEQSAGSWMPQNQFAGAQGSGSVSVYYSGSLMLAKRLGRSGVGVELESLRGTGTAQSVTGDADFGGDMPPLTSTQSASTVSETRLTAGYSFDVSRTGRLGVFYRYAWIGASDIQTSASGYWPAPPQSTTTGGHSSEIGMRWRGQFSPRLSYGFTASWLGLSLVDGLVRMGAVNAHQRDAAQRGSAAIGVGYQLTRRVVLAADLAGASTRSAAGRFADAGGAILQNGVADSHFVSAHGAVIVDLTRRLFVTASLMNVWHWSRWNVDVFPDAYGNRTLIEDSFFPLYSAAYPMAPRFSDYGAGWRFTRNVLAEYLFSTDYGFSGSSHTLMLRYTFRLKKE